MNVHSCSCLKLLLLSCMICLCVTAPFAQDPGETTPTDQGAATASEGASIFNDEEYIDGKVPAASAEKTGVSLVQNAVLEGVQLSSEKGAAADEKIVTCYFIFKEQPSSYFYDSKLKEKKIVFEFNDTQLGNTPILSTQETPIQGFRVDAVKVDVNAAVKGLTPEWHDVLKVSFFLDNVPQISVKDEFSIISFTFQWSSDPEKVKAFIVKPKNPKPIIFATLGVGAAAGAAAAYWWKTRTTPAPVAPDMPLDTTDLPDHPTGQLVW
jgi:hypothetical protein